MNHFWKLINEAVWQEDLNLIDQAQEEHNRLVVAENVKYNDIVDEIDRVNREDQPEHNEMARIYLNSLNSDLSCIKRDQARRLEAIEGRTKTIKLYQSWDNKAKA
jgi:hypothetical protein